MRTLIILPAHNEAATVVEVVRSIARAHPSADYLVVDDGSTDDTSALLRANGLRHLTLPVHIGLAGAVKCGVRYALAHGYDGAIQFDADGQHPVEAIQPLIDKLREGYDVVVASRYLSGRGSPTAQGIGNLLISRLIRLTSGQTLYDSTSGLRIYNRSTLHALLADDNDGPEPDTLCRFMRKGLRLAEIPVTMRPRAAGKSYLTLFKGIHYMLQMALSILILQWVRAAPKRR